MDGTVEKSVNEAFDSDAETGRDCCESRANIIPIARNPKPIMRRAKTRPKEGGGWGVIRFQEVESTRDSGVRLSGAAAAFAINVSTGWAFQLQ